MTGKEGVKRNYILYVAILVLSVAVIALAMVKFIGKMNNPAKPPHIVLILADDLGWNDVGWNNPNIRTPQLNKLANDGMIMNQTYVQPLCTPTRTALMTGYYPFRTGLQHSLIWPVQRGGLPLEFKLLPEKLKEVGYSTHLIGKWHLGHTTWDHTPLHRGFDSFLGHYCSQISHYDKTKLFTSGNTCIIAMVKPQHGDKALSVRHEHVYHVRFKCKEETYYGYDFRDNSGVVQKDSTLYSTMIYTERAVDIISKHYVSYPMFLYFAIDQPAKGFEVPSQYENLYPDIENENVRKYYGKLSLMDEAVGNITSALKSRGMWDNTVLIFMGDNGGLPVTQGNNLPFRSLAATLFEGGSRVPAIIHGPQVKKGYIHDGVNHITDWHTTILSMVGIKPESDLHGINILDMIRAGTPSPRNEFVYNIDQYEQSPGAAIRVGDWKLIVGNPNMMYPDFILSQMDGWWPVDKELVEMPVDIPPPANVTLLFNLKDDPEERIDLSDQFPTKVGELRQRLDEYTKGVVPLVDLTLDPAADPDNSDGVYTPWL